MHTRPTRLAQGSSLRGLRHNLAESRWASCVEDTMEEEWRAISGHEGFYEVSDQGAIRSLRLKSRYVSRPRETPLRLKQHLRGNNGPLYRCVRIGGKTHRIHRLVLEAFAGPCPSGHESAHLDGNSCNNLRSNLVWATGSENQMMRYEHGTMLFGEANPSAKLTWREVCLIRERAATGEKQVLIARDMGVSVQLISSVVSGRTWRRAPDGSPAQIPATGEAKEGAER